MEMTATTRRRACILLAVLSPLLLLFVFRSSTISDLRLATPKGAVFYPANDMAFTYRGRWEMEDHPSNNNQVIARADWPCSGVKFGIVTTTGSSKIALRLNLHRLRVSVKVTNADSGTIESETILQGNTLFDYEKNYEITLPEKGGSYTVSLTKLTQAAPYGNGVGKHLLSVLDFHGVEAMQDTTTLASSFSEPPLQRRITMIGASDTAGFCVDGSPETSDAKINPWKYDNCDRTSHALLGRRLEAETSVQAISGIGLTQNAFASTPFLLGKDTMPDYYSRTLQTKKEIHERDLSDYQRPDVVIVSLGGNDFNHQREVPSNDTFGAAYEDFLLEITKPYMDLPDKQEIPTIISVCGQGDPTEVQRDPNNDRCRPCPHVEAATKSFQNDYPSLKVEYVFVPCDGSVVTGDGDIGCEGHKNALGQKRVADFLEPRLREIMGWEKEADDENKPIIEQQVTFSSTTNEEPATSTETSRHQNLRRKTIP